jgi:hypothetical protein
MVNGYWTSERFDRAKPVLLILPVWGKILITVHSQDPQISQFLDLPFQDSRYKDGTR